VTVTTVDPYQPERAKEVTVWTAAAILVCVVHVGLAAAYLLLKPEPEARAEAPVTDVVFVPETNTPAPAVPETQQSVDQPPTPDVTPPKEETAVQPEPAPPPVALSMPTEPEQVTAAGALPAQASS
jgi:protein TonB